MTPDVIGVTIVVIVVLLVLLALVLVFRASNIMKQRINEALSRRKAAE